MPGVIDDVMWIHKQQHQDLRFYLDKDGDIVMESTFNIPGDGYPVHVEIVGDQILRMNSAWQEFYRDLSDVFDQAILAAGRQIAFNH